MARLDRAILIEPDVHDDQQFSVGFSSFSGLSPPKTTDRHEGISILSWPSFVHADRYDKASTWLSKQPISTFSCRSVLKCGPKKLGISRGSEAVSLQSPATQCCSLERSVLVLETWASKHTKPGPDDAETSTIWCA